MFRADERAWCLWKFDVTVRMVVAGSSKGIDPHGRMATQPAPVSENRKQRSATWQVLGGGSQTEPAPYWINLNVIP
jgi:hypothetical protein